MGAPTQWDYEKLRKDADRLVMLLADPDLPAWEVIFESVMSHLMMVAPTPVLSQELLRRQSETSSLPVGSDAENQ
jgi:hypothetical protein